MCAYIHNACVNDKSRVYVNFLAFQLRVLKVEKVLTLRDNRAEFITDEVEFSQFISHYISLSNSTNGELDPDMSHWLCVQCEASLPHRARRLSILFKSELKSNWP